LGPRAVPSFAISSCASSSIVVVTPNESLVASVPAMLWNSTDTGAPRSTASICVEMWASTQVWVGIATSS
jgi:hypothetical protein